MGWQGAGGRGHVAPENVDLPPATCALQTAVKRPVGRGAVFFALLVLFGLAACRPAAPPADGVSPVQIQRLNADYAVGRPRVSFALFDGPGPLAGVRQVDVAAVPVDAPGAEAQPPLTAVAYDDYEIPYWVVYPNLTHPGVWGLTAVVTLASGETLESQFLLPVTEESTAVPLGAAAPASQNRTLATEPDLHQLSSGNDPNPALYQMTVAEALATGRPTVVAFATPGLCQTRWCAPVLESVEAVQAEVGDSANFIHIEVYEDFQALTWVPEMAEWGLETEPWVYVLDETGRVAAAFSGPLSPRELRQAVAALLP